MRITLSGTLQYTDSAWLPYERRFVFFATPNPVPGFVVVTQTEIELDIPDEFDPRVKQIEQLQEALKGASQRFDSECHDLLRQIRALQAPTTAISTNHHPSSKE